MIEANEGNFELEVLKSNTPVLVDFYAPWCGPCRMIAPLLEEWAKEFSGRVKFVKVNVDHAPQLAMQYNITGVPTLILVRGGQAIETLVGFGSPQVLKAKLEALAAGNPVMA